MDSARTRCSLFCHKLVVEEQGTPQKPIQSFLHLDVEYGRSLPVNRDVFPVQIWRNLHHQLCQSALEDHGNVLTGVSV